MRRRLIVAVFAVIGVFALISNFSAKPSGCPVDVDRSTEDAQVFLMGTIGGAYEDPNRDCWREDVVQPVLDELAVSYFNPVVSNWTPESAETEARVIAQAETIVLVITAAHPSIGSLAESGWAVLSAIERNQTIIIYIAPDSSSEDSWRARQIVLSQAYPLAEKLDNVIIVDSLDDLVAALREHYSN